MARTAHGYVGTAPKTDRELYTVAMKCPRCTTTEYLRTMETDAGTTLDFCQKCNGIWFDIGEVEDFLNATLPLGVEEPPATPMDCPRCDGRLMEVTYPQVDLPPLDRCYECGGFWFDDGEVATVRAMIRNPQNKTLFQAREPTRQVTEVNGKVVPILTARPTKNDHGLSWFWVASGFVILLGLLGGSSLLLSVWIATDAINDQSLRPSWTMATAAMVGSFTIGGAIIGWRSEGFTILEPALAALPAALLCPLLVGSHFTTSGLLAAMMLAFGCALIGAILGERITH